eukprot:8045027-Pyramimonas_sp.AAC.1
MHRDSLDALVGIARASVGNDARASFLFKKDEFKSASKTLPMHTEHLQHAVATWAEAERRAMRGIASAVLSRHF